MESVTRPCTAGLSRNDVASELILRTVRGKLSGLLSHLAPVDAFGSRLGHPLGAGLATGRKPGRTMGRQTVMMTVTQAATDSRIGLNVIFDPTHCLRVQGQERAHPEHLRAAERSRR